MFKTYGHRFRRLALLTNGYFKVSDKLLSVLRNPKIYLQISNYTHIIKDQRINDVINDNIKTLKEHSVVCYILEQPTWFHWTDYNRPDCTEQELIAVFDNCARCNTTSNGMLHSCSSGMGIANRRLGKPDLSGSVSLTSDDERIKYILLEAYMGFTQKGYVDGCKICPGTKSVNKETFPGGEQL